MPITLSLIFGGIIGNLCDRLRFGAVTDFLSIHIRDVVVDFTIWARHIHVSLNWPAFNVADSSITVAMFLLIIMAFRQQKGER